MNKFNLHIIGWKVSAILLIVSLWSSHTVFAQVRGKIVEMDTKGTFVVSVVPEKAWEPPKSYTNTAVVTLKVPTGTFLIESEDIVSINGVWELDTRLSSPSEAPEFDYLIFNLLRPLTDLAYEVAIELPLFSFLNTIDCPGDVQIIDPDTDPFMPPNSRNANIGNHFAILGNGIKNAYTGTIRTNELTNCHLEFDWHFDEVNCYGDSTQGVLTFVNGTAPLHAVVRMVDKEGYSHYFLDTLWEVGDQFVTPGNLIDGTHSLFLVDAAFDTLRHTFTVDLPEEITIIPSKQDVHCNNPNGAFVHLVVNGLKPNVPYSFEWSNGHKGNILEGARIGNYQVTLTYGSGCTEVSNFVVEGVPPIEITVEKQKDPSCPTIEDGAITINATGGISVQYFYEWSDPELPKQWAVNQLKQGKYSVTVFDISGCVASTEVNLKTPPPIAPKLKIKHPTCPDFSDGELEIEPNDNGALPFKYSLGGSKLKGKKDYSELAAGQYTLFVVDNNDCIMEEQLVIEEPPNFAIELGENQEILIGERMALRETESLENDYEFYWEPAESLNCFDCPNPIATPQETTTYSVMVVNESGCIRTDEVTLNVNLDRPVYFPTAFSPNGDGYNDYFEIPLGKTTSAILNLQVFNRWGQLVYDSDNTGGNVKWDGTFNHKVLPEGVYLYSVIIQFADGKIENYKKDILLVK